MGSAKASVYLGNAATVAATAVAGRIIDPRSVIQEG
jgi:homoaconitase/3-isopropylmalate dehydratase large subunit